jgi:DNA topoisomerase-1
LAAGENAAPSSRVLGVDPETGLEVSVRSGRFGPYIQLGEGSKDDKPKRAGLPKGVAPDEIDLPTALGLLALPREVGKHPEDGEPIVAGIGRFGAYVKHGKTYANLEAGDEVLNIGLNRAVTLIAEKKLKPAGGRRFGADPGRELGEHPDKGGPIVAKKGRYGAYVAHDGINATIPADKTLETITLEEAAALIDARIAAGAVPKKKKAPADKKAEKPQKTAKPKAAKKATAAAKTGTKAKAKTASKAKTTAKTKSAAPFADAAKPARKLKVAG